MTSHYPFTLKVLLDLGPIRIFDNPYRPSSGALSTVDAPINRGQPATPGEKSGLVALGVGDRPLRMGGVFRWNVLLVLEGAPPLIGYSG